MQQADHSSEHGPAEESNGGEAPGVLDEDERRKAAQLIQKTYRGHRARRALDGFGLDASTRWYEAVQDAQFKQITDQSSPRRGADKHDSAHDPPRSPAKQNWNRIFGIAKHAAKDDHSPSITDDSEAEPDSAPNDQKKTAKQMELQYWLEFVDHKHRHGSSLRKYHAYWIRQDTGRNFFDWLDNGPGKDLDLPDCSRKKLDSQQVRYLSREERLNYLVNIDDQGLLVWAKNKEPVWTKDELYRDSMKGIVPVTDPTPSFKYNVAPGEADSSSQSSDTDGSSSAEEDGYDPTAADEGAEYINESFHRASGPKKIKYVSASVLFDHMIRSSLKKGHKWIFVADTSFRLYIGYKQAGAFQHSSLLSGARIAAAGQIKVKRGQLRRLSPLSGHYRPAAANFRAFVQHLKAAGCDMSHVSISQSYAVLVGLEGYVKTRKKVKDAEKSVAHQKDRVMDPEKAKRDEEAVKDKSQSAEKERKHIEQKRLEQNKAVEQSKAEKKSKRRLSRLFKRFRSSERKEDAATITGDKKLPGSGPEEGIPPPEGKLLRP